MKKILSLLLAMLLCLGVLVACDDETPSDSSSDDASSKLPTENSNDIEFPLISHQVEIEYVHYNLVANNDFKSFQNWIFNAYKDFNSFISENAVAENFNDINEELFGDNFVVIIYRDDGGSYKENYCYGDFVADSNSNDAKYFLTFEYTVYPNKLREQMEVPDFFDIVIIPRATCAKNPTMIQISIKAIEHKYTYEYYIME